MAGIGTWALADMIGGNGAPDAGESHDATVTRIDGDGKVWVAIPGGADETPIDSTLADVSEGDAVRVTIHGGRAVIDGSTSAPSISAQRANELLTPIADAATQAANASAIAQAKADEATDAAASAVESAAKAEVIVDTLDEMAEESGKTVQEILEDAGTAGAAAQAAQTAAKAAQYGLSDVEKVVGTVNWIAEHGQYVNQAGETFDATKTYYTRSGTSPNYTYAIVANPVAADIATYYLLDVDESVQNFLASHVWMDGYGLNISVDSANGYRIHQGTVDGTQAAGMYILDGGGDIVGTFNADGIVLGDESGGNYVMIDDDGLDLYHMEGSGASATKELIAHLGYGDAINGSRTVYAPFFTLGLRQANVGLFGDHSCSLGWFTRASGTAALAEGYMTAASGSFSHSEGSYTSASNGKAHAEGYQTTASGNQGSHSEGQGTLASGESAHAEGVETTASGAASHAEGVGDKNAGTGVASGLASHVEGRDSVASGSASHAQNVSTLAAKQAQTTLGTFNAEDTASTTTHPSGTAAYGEYAAIIGNGTSDDARSNALAVRWDGIPEFRNPNNTWGSVFDLIYPVGSIYMSVNSTDPGTLFGGTWERIQGKFLLAATGDTASTATDIMKTSSVGPGGQGGEAAHTLSANESGVKSHGHGFTNPTYKTNSDGAHTHTITTKMSKIRASGNLNMPWANGTDATSTAVNSTSSSDSNCKHNHTISQDTSGSVTDHAGESAGESHNNMPPFLAVYVWKRVPDPVS